MASATSDATTVNQIEYNRICFQPNRPALTPISYRPYKVGVACAQWKTKWINRCIFITLLHSIHWQTHFFFYKFKLYAHSNDSVTGD